MQPMVIARKRLTVEALMRPSSLTHLQPLALAAALVAASGCSDQNQGVESSTSNNTALGGIHRQHAHAYVGTWGYEVPVPLSSASRAVSKRRSPRCCRWAAWAR